MSRSVLVVGDVMLDVVVRPRGPVAPTSDTPAQVRVLRGGSAATLAVVLARGGHDVLFAGASGDDAAADLVESSLVASGVRVALQRSANVTGTVVALVDAEGQRAMLTDRGANPLLHASFLSPLMERVDHVHVSGYAVLDDATRDLASWIFAEGSSGRFTTSVDVCSLEPLRQLTREVFVAATSGVHYLFANEEEARELAGVDELDTAIERLADLYAEVFVTRGAAGAASARNDERHEVSAHEVMVLDTTGAGDAATGAYLSRRLSGGGVVEAMRDAMDAGASAAGQLGAPS